MYESEMRVSVLGIVVVCYFVFDYEEVVNMICIDMMDIDFWNEEKIVVFIVIFEINMLFNFIVVLMFVIVGEVLWNKLD